MPETLVVHLGREEPRSVAVPESFEAHGPFEVELVNHGIAAHVNLRLGDALGEVATVEGDNPYVGAEETQRVRVHVAAEDREVRGTLTVTTGYGAESDQVAVNLIAPVSETVEVDESLSKPQAPRQQEAALGEALASLSVLPVALLSLVALVLAGGAFVWTRSAVVGVGAFVVVGAVLVAVYATLN
ncbi:MAG: hypothetical protein ABEJ23_06585 [Haloarculaceae archaeon]